MYVLQFLDLQRGYADMFIELLRCMEEMQAKEHTKETLDKLAEDLAKVMRGMECMMPLVWNTLSRHTLKHVVDLIRRCGPFKAHNMLCLERWHVIFKNLCRGKKNVLVYVHSIMIVIIYTYMIYT